MPEAEPSFVTISSREGEGARKGGRERRLAVRSRAGGSPGLFWMGGYKSDMLGSKAVAMDDYAAANGLAGTRFDYSGHGESSGDFEDSTISEWLADSRAVFEAETQGPQIVIGSSMGGWLALLLAEALKETGRGGGLVLIAPAADMTNDLMWALFTDDNKAEIERNGVIYFPNDYSEEPTPVTWKLIEDGKQHLFGKRLIETGCPIHILQGANDAEVPWRHAMKLVSHLASDDVVFTLVKDADHRMSRDEDLARLRSALGGLIAEMETED